MEISCFKRRGSLAMHAAISPGFISRSQLGRRASSRLFLEIDVGEGLAAERCVKRTPAIRAPGVINEPTDVAPNSMP
jgi:hypothetical protein